MAMIYTPGELVTLNLVECSDGHYRTPERKEEFEAGHLQEVWCALRHVWIEERKPIDIPSQITPNQAGS